MIDFRIKYYRSEAVCWDKQNVKTYPLFQNDPLLFVMYGRVGVKLNLLDVGINACSLCGLETLALALVHILQHIATYSQFYM